MPDAVLTRHGPRGLTYLVTPVPWLAIVCRCGWRWD